MGMARLSTKSGMWKGTIRLNPASKSLSPQAIQQRDNGVLLMVYILGDIWMECCSLDALTTFKSKEWMVLLRSPLETLFSAAGDSGTFTVRKEFPGSKVVGQGLRRRGLE